MIKWLMNIIAYRLVSIFVSMGLGVFMTFGHGFEDIMTMTGLDKTFTQTASNPLDYIDASKLTNTAAADKLGVSGTINDILNSAKVEITNLGDLVGIDINALFNDMPTSNGNGQHQ